MLTWLWLNIRNIPTGALAGFAAVGGLFNLVASGGLVSRSRLNGGGLVG